MSNVTLLNSTTLLVPKGTKVTGEIKYLLGSVYDAKWGGWLVPWNHYKGLSAIAPMPPTIYKYCRDLEDAYNYIEGVKNGTVKTTGDPFLLKHQKVAHTIARLVPSYAFFMDTGTGKTATMLSVIHASDIRWVVLCPKAIMKTAWRDDADKFYPDMPIFVHDKSTRKEVLQEIAAKWYIKFPYATKKDAMFSTLREQAKVIVINPEQFKNCYQDFVDMGYTGLIIDESTTVKNPMSQISKAVEQFRRSCERVYILSGEPAPNGVEDYFMQMKLINPAILGSGWTAFKDRYFDKVGYLGYDIVPKAGAIDTISQKIATSAYFIRKEDCLDLPEKTYLTRTFELSLKDRSTYKNMLDLFIAQVTSSEEGFVSVGTKGAALMKLRQIINGFIIDEKSTPHRVHEGRVNLLEETLDEIGKKQVIIWTQFREDVHMISEMLKKKKATFCTAYSETKDVQDSIDGFKQGKYQYIIAHPATLKYGVTFTNCSYAVYYSYSYNYEEYYQSHDRIYRYGQTVPCTFIRLECEDTIDAAMWEAIEKKHDLATFVSDLIKAVKG